MQYSRHSLQERNRNTSVIHTILFLVLILWYDTSGKFETMSSNSDKLNEAERNEQAFAKG